MQALRKLTAIMKTVHLSTLFLNTQVAQTKEIKIKDLQEEQSNLTLILLRCL